MASPKTDAVILFLDPTPLIQVLEERGILRNINSPTLRAWRQRGIDVYQADKWATRLGMHPFEMFGMAFYEEGVPKNPEVYSQR